MNKTKPMFAWRPEFHPTLNMGFTCYISIVAKSGVEVKSEMNGGEV